MHFAPSSRAIAIVAWSSLLPPPINFIAIKFGACVACRLRSTKSRVAASDECEEKDEEAGLCESPSHEQKMREGRKGDSILSPPPPPPHSPFPSNRSTSRCRRDALVKKFGGHATLIRTCSSPIRLSVLSVRYWELSCLRFNQLVTSRFQSNLIFIEFLIFKIQYRRLEHFLDIFARGKRMRKPSGYQSLRLRLRREILRAW